MLRRFFPIPAKACRDTRGIKVWEETSQIKVGQILVVCGGCVVLSREGLRRFISERPHAP